MIARQAYSALAEILMAALLLGWLRIGGPCFVVRPAGRDGPIGPIQFGQAIIASPNLDVRVTASAFSWAIR